MLAPDGAQHWLVQNLEMSKKYTKFFVSINNKKKVKLRYGWSKKQQQKYATQELNSKTLNN